MRPSSLRTAGEAGFLSQDYSVPRAGETTLVESGSSEPLSHQEGENLSLLLSQNRIWGAQKTRVRVSRRLHYPGFPSSQGHLNAVARMLWCRERLMSPARLGLDLAQHTAWLLPFEVLPASPGPTRVGHRCLMLGKRAGSRSLPQPSLLPS